jgi:hypothetical protein
MHEFGPPLMHHLDMYRKYSALIRRNERMNVNNHGSRQEKTEQTLPGGLSARRVRF